ncbi:MAG: ester cyclase [Dehalococcoidia bacterium]
MPNGSEHRLGDARLARPNAGGYCGRPPGPAGVKQHIAMLRSAFPDLQVTIEDLIAEADRVVARLTMRGTHDGDFRGRTPTGRPVTWTGIVIYRLRDGRVVEQWSHFDTRALIEQIDRPPSA